MSLILYWKMIKILITIKMNLFIGFLIIIFKQLEIMGRYYNGDINGKFWFALQSSDAASRFGGQEFEPQFIEYHFDEDHLDAVNEEIKNIQDSLGDKIKVLDDFFREGAGYNDKTLEELGVTNKELNDYADLGLGIQIRDCIKEIGHCEFQAEL